MVRLLPLPDSILYVYEGEADAEVQERSKKSNYNVKAMLWMSATALESDVRNVLPGCWY